MCEFTEKVALQPPVRKRIQVPRRRPEMHLDADTVQLLRKMHMVTRNRKLSLRHGIKFFTGLAMRKEEGFHRCGRNHLEILQEGDDLLAAAIDPDVDIAALPHKLVRVQARIGGPFQDGGTPPLLLEKLSKVRSLFIYQAVMPADSLGFARPLEGEVQRRLPVLREFADARIGDAHHRKFGRQRIQKRPLFGGLYVEISTLPLACTECKPNEGEESFLRTWNQGLSQRVLIVRSEAERAMGAVISFTRIFKQIHPASKLHDFHFRFSVFFSFFHKFLHLVTLDKLYIHAITQQVCRIIQFNDLHFRCYVFLFFVHNYRTITCLPLK